MVTCVWFVKIINSKQFFVAAGEQPTSVVRELDTLDDVLVWKVLKLITRHRIPYLPDDMNTTLNQCLHHI